MMYRTEQSGKADPWVYNGQLGIYLKHGCKTNLRVCDFDLTFDPGGDQNRNESCKYIIGRPAVSECHADDPESS
jgi:hypothetical protein